MLGLSASAASAQADGPSPAVGRATDAGREQTAERERAHVQLLGFNDFHGQLGGGRQMLDRPAGSAAVLAAYLRRESARFQGATLIVHAGDFVGGSPVASSLLQDEPAIAFLNLLGNEHCRGGKTPDARCNVVGTLGNHEFDEGVAELLRLLRGGDAKGGPFLEQPYRGARVPYVSANVVDTRGKPILPAYTLVRVERPGAAREGRSHAVRIAVVGAVLTTTPNMVLAEGIAGVRFIDEAEAINLAVRQVRKRGVEAIVVTIHQGAGMVPYEGPTRRDVSLPPESDIAAIVSKLDPAVDVVITGHAHQFTNALYKGASGREILVTQAHSAGMAYADIELTIDRASGDVVEKSAQIVTAYADTDLTPAADVAALVERAEQKANAILTRVVGTAARPLSQTPNEAGESALGNLIADAQRRAVGAQVAFINQGAIRADLDGGPITWGELLAIHPFGNVVISVELSGAQIRRALEEQFEHAIPRILQVSGLSYRWDASLPVGKRVVAARVGDLPLGDDTLYRVAMSDYLARGGGGFSRLSEGKKRIVGPRDTDALSALIEACGGKAEARIEARIVKRE
jgi:5'-nucleotidase